MVGRFKGNTIRKQLANGGEIRLIASAFISSNRMLERERESSFSLGLEYTHGGGGG